MKKSKYNICVRNYENKKTIVFNGISQNIIEVNDDELKQFEEMDNSSIYYEDYVDLGFYVNDELDEFKKIVKDNEKYVSEKNQTILNYTIALTLKCQLNCIYCFEQNNKYRLVADDKTIDNIYHYIEKNIKDDSKVKKVFITWFGGEPMMAYDKMIMLSSRIKKLCENKKIIYDADMITNGLFLSTQKSKELKEAGIKGIQITLDGLPKECAIYKKGSESEYINLYNTLPSISKNILVKIRFNLFKENLDSCKKAFDRLIQDKELMKNCLLYFAEVEDYYNDSSLYTPLSNEEIISFKKNILNDSINKNALLAKNLLRFPKRRISFCGASKPQNVTIDPEGFLYKCEQFIGDRKMSIGSIESGLNTTNKVYKKYVTPFVPKNCENCAYLPVCLGGCPSRRFFYKINPKCEVIKYDVDQQLLLYSIQYKNKRKEEKNGNHKNC